MKSSRLNYADWRTINQIEKINESTAHNTVFESMALQGLIIFLFLSAPLLKHANIVAHIKNETGFNNHIPFDNWLYESKSDNRTNC
jgi:hypothetical protein